MFNVTFNDPEFRYKEIKNAFGEKCISINTDDFNYIEDKTKLYSLCDDIHKKFLENDKHRLIFDILPEGMMFVKLQPINFIVGILIEKYNLSVKDFGIACGCIDIIENDLYYDYHCKKLNFVKLEIKFRNSYETGGPIVYTPDLLKNCNLHPKIKQKKFLCYNGSSKQHRLFLVSELIKRNLFDKGWLSCYYDPNKDSISDTDKEYYYGKNYDNIVEIFTEHKEKFPIDLGLLNSIDTNRSHQIIAEDLHHYETSYFGVITESKFYHDNYHLNILRTNSTLDGYLISEKTYKFIQGRLPFILIGFTGSLRALRQRGYKTFYPYINESYDMVDNDIERLIAAVDEIERLCTLSDSDWLELQKELMPIINHNFELLATKI